MHYINTALNPMRLLNHAVHIKKCCGALDQNVQDNILKKAGHIELQLTDQCNLKCSFCRFREQGDSHLNFELLHRINCAISPSAITISGGGEPTCFPKFNEAISVLSKKNNVKLGLVTNGVNIPCGSWHGKLSWLRVSVYTTINEKYSGVAASTKERVINNIVWYLQHTKIPRIGIQLLFYQKNINEIATQGLFFFELLEKYNINFDRVYLQFKAAHILASPSVLSSELHDKHIHFLPTDEQINNLIFALENIQANNDRFKYFVKTCTNIHYLYDLMQKRLKHMRKLSDPQIGFLNSFSHCYFCLAHRLITPNGDIYPCATLANYRNKRFFICNIKKIDNTKYLKERINIFYHATTEMCNHEYCLYSKQNLAFETFISSSDLSDDNSLDLFL